VHRTAAREHPGRADDLRHRPVAAFHQHVRAARLDERRRRVVVEPGDRVHRRERRDQRHAVGQRIHRPARPLAQAPYRGIAVQRHDKRGAQGARARQVGHVPAVQEVEHAIGEHERPRQRRRPARGIARREDLALESGGAGAYDRGRHTSSVGLQYSNIFTTLRTPAVVRAISTAAAASSSVTMPSR
jgi:hypothetical protein